MSVSLWAWVDDCDYRPCPGDCDICRKADENTAEEEEEEEDG